jgi:Putative Ig domain
MRAHNPDFKHPAGGRRLAFGACALAAIMQLAAAHAHGYYHHWQPRPTISGTPSTTDVAGNAYSFTPTASAPRGYTLTFSISGKPSWASFNRTTGQLAGTPTAANVGSFANIAIGVSDGVASASLAPFTIKVSAPVNSAPPPPSNTPPTISGTPASTAAVGTLYSFTPKASDTDGDPLSFSVQNKPSWASFSIASGALSGTPTSANAGTYSSIVISVSDGHTSASLAPFSINVPQPATSGSATLTWTAPVTNTNGSALTDLAGYHIHYGSSPSALSTVIDIANAGTTSYTVSNLASGTWYFAVSAYTTSGDESALSNTGSKSIP